jgi:predicted Rossmann fold nucleotide-binding protein DprA/Smf involved in DNA uptake
VSSGRRNREPAPSAPDGAARARTAKPARAPARAPRGQNKAKVLDALKDGPMTASEIAQRTGIATGTVSTLLTKMAKASELAKAQRGYRLP